MSSRPQRAASSGVLIRALIGLGLVAPVAPGCMLDFSGLSDGDSATMMPDAAEDAEPMDGDPPDAGDSAADGEPPDDQSVDSPDDLPVDSPADTEVDAGCGVLACGACEQPCPPEGCAPTTLVTGVPAADQPRGIVAASDGVYWVSQGSGQIVRLAEQPGTSEVLTTADSPVALAVTQGKALWAERSGVFACEVANCQATRHPIAASLAPGSIRGVALDGTTAYWTDRGAGATTTDGAVRKCAVDSCATPTELTTGGHFPQGLALAGGWLFWGNQGDGFVPAHVLERPGIEVEVRVVVGRAPVAVLLGRCAAHAAAFAKVPRNGAYAGAVGRHIGCIHAGAALLESRHLASTWTRRARSSSG